MEELQTINQIINESVKDSSYITVIISSCIFILYTLIVKLVDYFKSKSKTKPLLEMASAITGMGENVVKLNSVLDRIIQDANKKEIRQSEHIIDSGLKALGFKVMHECANIIAHNNIETNKTLITENITKLVNTEYYSLYSKLAIYEVNQINLSSRLRELWIDELITSILTILYNGQDGTTRIIQLSNKITILLNDYSTYLNNKILNT